MTKNRGTHAAFPWMRLLVVLAFSSIVGCGPAMAPVSGKVTYRGELVKGGSLTFSPVAGGKAGGADIKPDGTYVAKTNGVDGVLVGPCRILYTPPQVELTAEQKQSGTYEPPPSPYVKMRPRQAESEVKSGKNTIDIELVPPQEVGVPGKK